MNNNDATLSAGAGMAATGKRKKGWAVFFLAGLAMALGFIPVAILKAPAEKREPPPVVIRIDDIQDYAFREGQVFLLTESMTADIPVSLAVIPGEFGEDLGIVQMVKLAVGLGSEVTVHGWEHEDLASLSAEEQAALLGLGRGRLAEVIGCDSKVLVPPMFRFNEATISAMQQAGYEIISSFIDVSYPGLYSGVKSVPGTVNLSQYSENDLTWNMKTTDAVEAEIAVSVEKYGYAVIVTHPQEFLVAEALTEANVALYRALLVALQEHYCFKTIKELGESRLFSPMPSKELP